MRVTTYATGLSTSGAFDTSNYKTTKSNHAHVEAYVDGRWIVMDPTWDSKNKYENGEFIARVHMIRYFDANNGRKWYIA